MSLTQRQEKPPDGALQSTPTAGFVTSDMTFYFLVYGWSAKNQFAGGKGRMENVISVPFNLFLLASTMCLCDVPLGGARRQGGGDRYGLDASVAYGQMQPQ